MKDKDHKRYFLQGTKKRIAELEHKRFITKDITRAEMFELDACRGDVKRLEIEVKQV